MGFKIQILATGDTSIFLEKTLDVSALHTLCLVWVQAIGKLSCDPVSLLVIMMLLVQDLRVRCKLALHMDWVSIHLRKRRKFIEVNSMRGRGKGETTFWLCLTLECCLTYEMKTLRLHFAGTTINHSLCGRFTKSSGLSLCCVGSECLM